MKVSLKKAMRAIAIWTWNGVKCTNNIQFNVHLSGAREKETFAYATYINFKRKKQIDFVSAIEISQMRCTKVCRKFGTFQMALTILHKIISETVSSVSHQCEQAFPVSISLCTKIVSKFVERLNSSAFDFEKKNMKRWQINGALLSFI